MALGGYGINFDMCCICGRSYRGEGRAVYKREKGRIACLKCERESARCHGLDPQTVRVINLMQTGPWASLKSLALTEQIASEIRPVLKLHREYHLGRRPKTACYLE